MAQLLHSLLLSPPEPPDLEAGHALILRQGCTVEHVVSGRVREGGREEGREGEREGWWGVREGEREGARERGGREERCVTLCTLIPRYESVTSISSTSKKAPCLHIPADIITW